jgi:predicted amidohydrolase YtcJ
MARRPLITHGLRFLACALLVSVAQGCDDPDAPDLIIHGARVLTMDPTRPEATAFAVAKGSLVAVGSDSEILALATDVTLRRDLGGRVVVPGFNDAHLHALMLPRDSVPLAEVESIDELVERMREGDTTQSARAWIIGANYDDIALGRHPTRADLDRISVERPVLAMHASGHLFAVNSAALDAAVLLDEAEIPDGGVIYRDDTGVPTGLLAELSALSMLFNEAHPTPFASDFSSALETLDDFYRRALSQGITSFTDALVPTELALVYWWSDPESHGMRVNLLLSDDDLGVVQILSRLQALTALVGWQPTDNAWLRARGVKINHGMSLSGRTARQYEPYAGRPDYYGLPPQRDQAALDALIFSVHAMGFQAAVHTNGDYEIDMVLDAIEAAVREDPRPHRHRIEHGSIVNAAILARMKALEVVIAPHSYIYEKGPMIEPYGEALWDRMFANASTFEYGIPNAGNSDYPISGLSPMLRIQSLVTRTSRAGRIYGSEQRLSFEQALEVYTMGGAYASFEEELKGSISPGKVADFVVLAQDPRLVPLLEIKDIAIDETWVAGRLRYSAGD